MVEVIITSTTRLILAIIKEGDVQLVLGKIIETIKMAMTLDRSVNFVVNLTI